VPRRATGERRLPHRRVLLLLPHVLCSVSTPTSRAEFHALAREHTVVPVWREVLADLTTPVAGFLRVVGDEPGFLLESVEHERWGRWSFVGRRAVATLVAHHGRVDVDQPLPDTIPLDRGVLAAIEGVL